jgi:iron complex outermembrane receptor protein
LENKPANTDRSVLNTYQSGSPHLQVVVDAQMDLGRGLQFDPIYRFVSAHTYGGGAAYDTADARIAWRPGSRLELSLVGQNLLQPHHPEWARDPGPTVDIRRSAYAQVAWGR